MYSFPNFEPVHCSMSGSNCCFLTRHSQMTKNSNPEEVRNNRGEQVANLTSLEEFPGEQGGGEGRESQTRASDPLSASSLSSWNELSTNSSVPDLPLEKPAELELDMNNGLVQNWERSTSRLHIVTLLILHIQSTSCEMLGWMKLKLESRLPGEISITSDVQMTPP